MAKLTLGPSPTPKPTPDRKQPPPAPPTLFEQLLPTTWRGIPFPVASMRVSLAQDLVEHKYWGIDAASVEATGRAPLKIEAVIPFVNGIVPGKGEKWGVLYPTTFREFVDSFQDKTTGTLNHPELGEITCKPQSLDFSHDARRRDGVEVTAHWIETRLPTDDGIIGTGPSPIQEAELAALDLDASKEDLVKLAPQAEEFEESFESLVNKLAGFADSTASTVRLITNKPNQIMHRVQIFQDSVQRARNALTWPVEHACERLKEAAIDIAKGDVDLNPFPSKRKIERFVAPANMALSTIVSALPKPNSVDEVMGLNPSLIARPAVSKGTVVKYYA